MDKLPTCGQRLTIKIHIVYFFSLSSFSLVPLKLALHFLFLPCIRTRPAQAPQRMHSYLSTHGSFDPLHSEKKCMFCSPDTSIPTCTPGLQVDWFGFNRASNLLSIFAQLKLLNPNQDQLYSNTSPYLS